MLQMNKIFVSIASYRDSELPKTVHDIISKAEYPELLKIVVYEQNDTNDPSVHGIYPESQVLTLRDHYSMAKGPTWARAKIQKEYNGEEYYLQLDSHMRTVQNWDTILKHMLDLLPEPAVLTQYPPEYKPDKNDFCDPDIIRSGLYIQGFSPKDRFTRIQSDIIGIEEKRRFYPYTSKAWAACFSFSKGNIVKDAAYESDFEYLFFGEELDITLKLFTRGYYLFSPYISVFYTLFKRDYRRTYWQDIPEESRKSKEILSRKKLMDRITGVGKNESVYGNVRTVDDYMKYACIKDFKECKLELYAKAFRRHTKRQLLR